MRTSVVKVRIYQTLDCRIYAMAASIALGVDKFTEKQWKRLAGDDLSLKAEQNTVSKTKFRASTSKPRPKIVKSKWMSGA
jgi:phage terminase large subunit GpA-like protein